MSFSVYNAFRFPKSMTMDDIFGWMDPLRAAVRMATEQAFQEALVRNAICQLDRDFLLGCGEPDLAADAAAHHFGADQFDSAAGLVPVSPVRAACRFLLEELRADQRASYRNPLDPETTLTVFRDTDRRLYGIVHTESSAARAVVESAPGLEDFSYSDAGDAPQGMSNKSWSARGALWDRLLGSSSVPASRGAVFQLAPADQFILSAMPSADQLAQVLKDIPLSDDRESRVRPRARESTSWQQHERDAGMDLTQPSDFINRFMELRKGQDSSFNALCDRMKAVLPSPVTIAMLFATPSPITPSPASRAPRRPG